MTKIVLRPLGSIDFDYIHLYRVVSYWTSFELWKTEWKCIQHSDSREIPIHQCFLDSSVGIGGAAFATKKGLVRRCLLLVPLSLRLKSFV